MTAVGDNMFGAMYNYLGQLVAKADPFKQAAIQKVKQQLHVHATMKNQVRFKCNFTGQVEQSVDFAKLNRPQQCTIL